MLKNPFHSGELAVQRRAGDSAVAQRNGGAISDVVIGGARPFLRQQPMLVLSSRDLHGGVWASLVFGKPGFLAADDGKHLDIDLDSAVVDPGDPVWENVAQTGQLGSLIIELASRRRLRINGPAHRDDANHLIIDVEESFPACPKYITRRMVRLGPSQGTNLTTDIERGDGALREGSVAIIRHADVMFVASQSPERGLDVSHRGGAPGFVKFMGPQKLRWPEFPGNGMYNTLGNLEQDPHVGIVLPDFEGGRVIQLSGSAKTLWNEPDPGNESAGTHRFVEMAIERWREASLPANLLTELLDYSPFNPPVVAA